MTTILDGMLRRIARAYHTLDSESQQLIADFVASRCSENGGFRGLDANADLYYSAFAFALLKVMKVHCKSTPHYLASLPNPEKLDFIHNSSFAWCFYCNDILEPRRCRSITARTESYRSANRGYHHIAPALPHGTPYGAFVAQQTYEICGIPVPDSTAMLGTLQEMRSGDGAYSNEYGAKYGTTTATAAGCVLLHNAAREIPSGVLQWLLARIHPQGGVCAAPDLVQPDLLSTATALFALDLCGKDITDVETCLDFVLQHWQEDGGFCGCVEQPRSDCEYTFYGLLALGCLL